MSKQNGPTVIDRKEKDGGCTCHQNALRSEIVSNTREEVIFFLCESFITVRVFLGKFFSHFCMMPAIHSGKMYTLPFFRYGKLVHAVTMTLS